MRHVADFALDSAIGESRKTGVSGKDPHLIVSMSTVFCCGKLLTPRLHQVFLDEATVS